MTIRLSEVGEYSQRVLAQRSNAPEYPSHVVPSRPATDALKRKFGGLALTEVDSGEHRARNGLGELVQVVT